MTFNNGNKPHNCVYIYIVFLQSTNNIHKLFTIKKNNGNKNNKNIFNKNGRRCRDIKTQKVCEQGQEVNIGPKLQQTTSI